jgi:YidC/Oxa1 family membrane protein insertase
VTQSLYSVVQQWFITGWGSLGDWIPGLPELPEHKRLGYRAPRDPNDVIVVSGEGGVPAKTGFMGWMQKRVEEAQAQQQAKAGGTARGSAPITAKTTDIDSSDEPHAPKGARPVKKGSAAARAQARGSRPGSGADGASATGSDDGQPSINGTRPRAVPKKSRASRPSGES